MRTCPILGRLALVQFIDWFPEPALYYSFTNKEMGLLQKIVKNDAMKEDPPEIYGWKVYFLAFSVRKSVVYTL